VTSLCKGAICLERNFDTHPLKVRQSDPRTFAEAKEKLKRGWYLIKTSGSD